ncbi:MAG: hypothetical protein KatS3mg110_2822 [Pirellulaceae bacterium]|nr:MAG: hypothetical protein KatS3mg110_2822 [Pirellulaceae bacterium]
MSIARCPRCRDEVTVPSHVSAEALVECPWCRETYPLAEAIDSMPPMLRVVGPSELRTLPVDSSEPELQLLPDEPARPIVVTDRPRGGRPVSRAQRPVRSKSLVAELAKIVAGGIVGLSIGQLILWWMPGRWAVSQRDPLGLAAKVSRWAPFVVPAHLRSGSARVPAAAFPDGSQAAPAKEPPVRSRPPTTSKGSNLPIDRRGPLSNEDPFLPPASRQDPGQSRTTDRGGKAPDRGPSAATKAQRDGQTPVQAGEPAARPAPTISSDAQAFSDLLLAAQFAAQQAEPSERLPVVAPFLPQIAQELPWLVVRGQLDAELFRELDDWLTGLASDRDEWGQLSGDRESTPQTQGERPGQILVGSVREIRQSGEWQELYLETSQSSGAVIVLIPPQLPVAVLAGDVVVVLGAGLSDTTAQLPEYPGHVTKATLAGWLYTLGRSERDELGAPRTSHFWPAQPHLGGSRHSAAIRTRPISAGWRG